MKLTAKKWVALGATEAQINQFRAMFPHGIYFPDIGGDSGRHFTLYRMALAGLNVDWYLQKTCESGTAYCWHDNGVLRSKSRYYRSKPKPGQVASPAVVIEWDRGGNLHRVEHRLGGKLNDTATEPAVKEWHPNGAVRLIEHYRRGKRCDTPKEAACREWDADGNLLFELPYFEGEPIK